MKNVLYVLFALGLLFAPASAQQVITTQQTTDTGKVAVGTVQVAAFLITAQCPSGCFMEAFDSATIPADGTYTGSSAPAFCYAISPPASPQIWVSGSMLNPTAVPRSVNGVAVVANTGADCYHLTKATAYVSMQFQ